MNPVDFSELARMPLLQHYEEVFRKATGVPLKLAPPGESRQRVPLGAGDNNFCALVAGTPTGCAACQKIQGCLQRNAARKLTPQKMDCAAGLTEIAVPVVIGGQHTATLLSGQVFRREPTHRDLEIVVKMFGGGRDKEWEKKTRKAYFEVPVVSLDKLHAIIEMLTMFAQHLSEDANRHVIACSEAEPNAVGSAKKFIQSHATETITLEEVLQHVHVSRFYFCKLFKRTTGVTLTEYVARVRMEKAKELLVDPSLRISEIVFAAGFGSIPQFNSVFKRFVGMSPSEYRTTLRRQSLQ